MAPNTETVFTVLVLGSFSLLKSKQKTANSTILAELYLNLISNFGVWLPVHRKPKREVFSSFIYQILNIFLEKGDFSALLFNPQNEPRLRYLHNFARFYCKSSSWQRMKLNWKESVDFSDVSLDKITQKNFFCSRVSWKCISLHFFVQFSFFCSPY